MAAKLTYSEQLKHPNWQRKRLEMLSDADFTCTCCGDSEKMLHVHHKKYIKGRMAWEYENTQLEVLCEDCHQNEHNSRALLDELLASGQSAIDVILGLATGYLLASMEDIDDGLVERIKKGRELHFEIGLAAVTLDRGSGLPWRDALIRHVEQYPPNPVTKYYADIWKAERDSDGKS